jgi:GAF domain-containing protein
MNKSFSLNSGESLDPQQDWRVRFLQNILTGSAIFGLLALIPAVISTPIFLLRLIYIAVYLVLLTAVVIRLPYSAKAYIFVLLPFVLGISSLSETGIRGDGLVFLLAFVIFSALLLGSRVALVTILLCELSITIMGYLILTGSYRLTGEPYYEGSLADWLSGGATLLLLSWVVLAGLRMLQEGFEKAQNQINTLLGTMKQEQENLEERVEVRTNELLTKTNQLNAAAYIAKQTAEIQDLDSLLKNTVNLISERFDFYHAGIFLINELEDYAVLQAASSEGGKRMIDRGHRLRVGSQGIVGFVASEKKPRIALDVGKDAVYFDNPELPLTRSEVALPLLAREKIIGILDIQSTEPEIFTQNDIEVFQTMADQIAVAIENIRLLSESQLVISQLESLSSEKTRNNWNFYHRTGKAAVHFSPTGLRPLEKGQEYQASGKVLEIPLLVRGQKIGKITLTRKSENPEWTQQEQTIAEDVALQTALALDNARLIEQTQKHAERELEISSIANKVRETLDVQSILRTSAREIQRVLNLEEAEVRLFQPEASKASTENSDERD